MLFIYCSGTISSEILDIALRCNYKEYQIRFVDDDPKIKNDVFKNRAPNARQNKNKISSCKIRI